jgi:hypothetical protein
MKENIIINKRKSQPADSDNYDSEIKVITNDKRDSKDAKIQ